MPEVSASVTSVAIGADEAAFDLKETLKAHLARRGIEVKDYGAFDRNPVLYPDVAVKVAQAVADGTHPRGILMCGTGIGMAITANKVPGVRAACCHDTYSAERARKSNNAQILTMGARVIGPELAKTIVDAWLASEFEGGGSAPKVQKIIEYDERFRRK
ncbi:MAG TPA: ribose 5-phosphate isomerase B [Spirochaetia bacterium]|nr:ribose 5-phosphate isomerase B [Spirochaetia bacterium]